MNEHRAGDGQDDRGGLLGALAVLRERWLLVVACATICLGAALATSLSSPRQYQATAKVLFRDPGLIEAVGGSSPPVSLDPQGQQATNVLLVRTNQLADRVRSELKLALTTRQMLSAVSTTSDQNASIVDITVTDRDPRRAAAIANAWAYDYTALRRASDRDKVGEGIALLRRRLASNAPADRADRGQIAAALQKLVVIEAVQTGNAEVADSASVPISPSSPKPKRDAIVALLLGLGLGAGAAFLLNALDRRLKELDEIESEFGVRVLASVPRRTREARGERELAAELEPFRILRNGVSRFRHAGAGKVLVVTSAVQGEGKTTIAVGLARAMALSGQKVVLVEGDLRRPSLHHHFDLGPDRRGVSTVLVGRVDPRALIRTVVPGLRSLAVLPCGPIPDNAAELVGSPEMGQLLDRLCEDADCVIVDAPPLLPVADAQILLEHPQVDGCLIVARAYQTTRDQARRARAVLERHRISNVGVIVNGVRAGGGEYEYYGSDERVERLVVEDLAPSSVADFALARPAFLSRSLAATAAPSGFNSHEVGDGHGSSNGHGAVDAREIL